MLVIILLKAHWRRPSSLCSMPSRMAKAMPQKDRRYRHTSKALFAQEGRLRCPFTELRPCRSKPNTIVVPNRMVASHTPQHELKLIGNCLCAALLHFTVHK